MSKVDDMANAAVGLITLLQRFGIITPKRITMTEFDAYVVKNRNRVLDGWFDRHDAKVRDRGLHD